jgi:hypothetical protein
MYNPVADRPAFQSNGRLDNLVVEQNIIYGTSSGMGIALYNGTSHSRILSNLLFNNNGGIHFSNYDAADCYTVSATGVCAHPQNGNLIANNVFYVGNMSGNITATGPALQVDDASTGCPTPAGGCTPAHQGGLGDNTYANNIFVSNNSGYRPVYFPLSMIGVGSSGTCQLDPADTTLSSTIFKNNILLGPGSSNVVSVCPSGSVGAPVGKSIAQLNAGLWSVLSGGNLNADPGFTSAAPSYYNSPGSFNFTPVKGSPLIGAGVGLSAAKTDIWGTTRREPPSIGAVEWSNAAEGPSACDIDGDGFINSVDVQLVVDQVLGISACVTGDLLHTTQCNVADVQRVINASLGGPCVTGQ